MAAVIAGMIEFVPTRDFAAQSHTGVRCEYQKGMTYTARTPELQEVLKAWLRDGLIKVVEPGGGRQRARPAKVIGRARARS